MSSSVADIGCEKALRVAEYRKGGVAYTNNVAPYVRRRGERFKHVGVSTVGCKIKAFRPRQLVFGLTQYDGIETCSSSQETSPTDNT